MVGRGVSDIRRFVKVEEEEVEGFAKGRRGEPEDVNRVGASFGVQESGVEWSGAEQKRKVNWRLYCSEIPNTNRGNFSILAESDSHHPHLHPLYPPWS